MDCGGESGGRERNRRNAGEKDTGLSDGIWAGPSNRRIGSRDICIYIE